MQLNIDRNQSQVDPGRLGEPFKDHVILHIYHISYSMWGCRRWDCAFSARAEIYWAPNLTWWWCDRDVGVRRSVVLGMIDADTSRTDQVSDGPTQNMLHVTRLGKWGDHYFMQRFIFWRITCQSSICRRAMHWLESALLRKTAYNTIAFRKKSWDELTLTYLDISAQIVETKFYLGTALDIVLLKMYFQTIE